MRTGRVFALLLLCLVLLETAHCCLSGGSEEEDDGPLLSTETKKSDTKAPAVHASGKPLFRPEYKGCYLDSKAEPDFEHFAGSRDRGMTKTQCAELCRERAASYMGVQGTDCWCGSLYGNLGVRHNDWCSLRCPDDAVARCGGVGFNSVYALKPGA